MEFITDNYIWFIIGGIVFFMAIVGYIADKTDFGRNKVTKEPKEKKEKEIKQPEKIEIDAKGLGELTQSVSEFKTEPVVEEPMADLFAPMEETIPVIDNNIDQSLYAPLGDAHVEPVNNVVDESSYQPLETVSEEVAVATVPEEITAPVLEPTVEVPEEVIAPAEEIVSSVVEEPSITIEPRDLEKEVQAYEEATTEEEPVVIDGQSADNVASEDDIWQF